MDSIWCSSHKCALSTFDGREHHRHECPWCKIESLQRERDELEQQNRKEAISHVYDLEYANSKIESLQRDKAALIEVLEWYGDEAIWMHPQSPFESSTADQDGGGMAREILSKMKG